MLEVGFIEMIARDASVVPEQVTNVIELFNAGSTIPFVARYRKDVTGNLDEVALEAIAKGNQYFTALSQRRASILANIEKQGKLTDTLRSALESCKDRHRLEDLYLPFKKKRRTRATIARELGLEPFADYILNQVAGDQTIQEMALSFVKSGDAAVTPQEAIEGALHIVAEHISTDAAGRALVRERMLSQGKVTTCTTKNSEGKKTKFSSYYEFTELVKDIPSHRLQAILRGVKEGMLRMELAIDDEAMQADLLKLYVKEPGSFFESLIRLAVDDTYKRLIRPSIENEVLAQARKRADEDAIRVFRENAENLLLAPPAGPIAIIGADPGLKSGCKLAVVDTHAAYQESATIFPFSDDEKRQEAETILLGLLERHQAYVVAIGNGTGSRETEKFVNEVLAKLDREDAFSTVVNEAGASVYSASKTARKEFPDLDVTIRGAISIARRLQDPLAELVKIEPRSVGVGQYQHDVNQKLLREGLHQTVESCVNRVGVDLNTASVALLQYVSGIQSDTAQNIVGYRSTNGGFKSRQDLLEVDGIGPKTFEQAGGFLRIIDGLNPLDATAIHPEAYPVVEKIAQACGVETKDLIENHEFLKQTDLSQFETEVLGKLTLEDIRNELLKPGRDPRSEFRAPKFLDGVNDIKDLDEGMEIEGVVTNVTAFGAFVDVGVHQDGLVHLSQLANRYVKDPQEVVHVGKIVTVKVIGVDKELPRISLSIKALEAPPRRRPRRKKAMKTADAPEGARQAQGEDRPETEKTVQARDGDRQEKPRARNEADGGRPRAERQRADRPEKRESEPPRAKRERRDKPTKANGKPRGTPSKSSGRRDKQPQEDKTPLNTQLADQLAALRDKFN